MKQKGFLTIRGKVSLPAAILLGAVPVAVIFALWWYLTAGVPEERFIPYMTLPSPSEVFGKFSDLLFERNLLVHIGSSLTRVGIAYLIAFVVVFPIGLLMGSFGGIRAFFAPASTASGYIPISTLVPLIMSWFGIGETAKIAFLALAFAIFMLPMIVRAIDSVPDVYLRTANTLGANRGQVVLRVLLPIAMPDIWAGMRLAFGIGWTYLMLAEVIAYDSGLGYLIETARRQGPRENIYLVILVITLIAWLSDMIWAYVGTILFPYRKATGK